MENESIRNPPNQPPTQRMLDIDREIRIVRSLPRSDFISSNTTSSMFKMNRRTSGEFQGGGLKATAPEFTSGSGAPGSHLRRQRSVTALNAVTNHGERRHSRETGQEINTISNIVGSFGAGVARALPNPNSACVAVLALVVIKTSPDTHHANNNNAHIANN